MTFPFVSRDFLSGCGISSRLIIHFGLGSVFTGIGLRILAASRMLGHSSHLVGDFVGDL